MQDECRTATRNVTHTLAHNPSLWKCATKSITNNFTRKLAQCVAANKAINGNPSFHVMLPNLQAQKTKQKHTA